MRLKCRISTFFLFPYDTLKLRLFTFSQDRMMTMIRTVGDGDGNDEDCYISDHRVGA